VLVVVLSGYVFSVPATAQEKWEPPGTPLPPDAQVLSPYDEVGIAQRLSQVRNGLPNIMLTGYWPPTNDMLRQFSPNPSQNPGGWVGENWEGRGYNIYAFFPEFPNGLGKGEGDFEVDYQDTSADFWPFTQVVQPMAIMTFGRAGSDYYWEIEMRQRNLPESSWVSDYLAPFKPTPAPPDDSVPPGYVRLSSLPVDTIAADVNNANLGITAFVDTTGYCGAFLCEYIAYHGTWYHDLHTDPFDVQWTLAAGHIHVGSLITVAQATQAVEISLRAVIAAVDAQRLLPGDLNCDRIVGFGDINPFVLRLTDPQAYHDAYPRCLDANGDINVDGQVNFGDINPFVALLVGGG
jgi:pyrrolidone-carboxylate peptidase